MSDEYTIAGNFQRHSDDPRAAAEYEYRMGRVREREAAADRLWALMAEAAEDQRQRDAEAARVEAEALARRSGMRSV